MKAVVNPMLAVGGSGAFGSGASASSVLRLQVDLIFSTFVSAMLGP